MMKEFRQKFIEDATELLDELEINVLALEKNKNDSECIEEVFRAMHTLKGTAGMYGFEGIGELTHKLENVYDLIRNGRIDITKEILDISLLAIDFMHKALKSNQETNLQHDYNRFFKQIDTFLSIDNDNYFDGNKKEIEKIASESQQTQTWFITIRPDTDLRKRGIKMHTIFDEMNELGANQIFNRYDKKGGGTGIFWEVFIATQATLQDIEDVLIFIDDICEIHLIAKNNLFENEAFIEKLAQLSKEKQTRLDEIREYVERIENQQTRQQVEQAGNITLESKKISNIKVSSDRLDEQMTLLTDLVSASSELQMIIKRREYTDLNKTVEQVQKITRRFRKNIFKIRLVPIETLQLRFDRLIRDLSAQLDKEINFVAEGMQTELDKNIIDSLEKPLMHIIRNCLDHGIEAADIRKSRGKPPKGEIKISARQAAAKVLISIEDDGKGIDTDKIRAKAIEKKIIKKDDKLSKNEIYDLIFKPGFSTAQDLTEVSGRGVGMDVVKQTINRLRGSVHIESEPGKGTRFTIKLPLTLSIIDTMLVKSGKAFYSIPLTAIKKCAQVSQNELQKSHNEHIVIEGILMPYIIMNQNISEIIKENNQKQNNEDEIQKNSKAVIIHNENKTAAILVDEVIGEHQAVIKPLGDYFSHQEYISGATQLADGHIAVVLDTERLIHSKT